MQNFTEPSANSVPTRQAYADGMQAAIGLLRAASAHGFLRRSWPPIRNATAPPTATCWAFRRANACSAPARRPSLKRPWARMIFAPSRGWCSRWRRGFALRGCCCGRCMSRSIPCRWSSPSMAAAGRRNCAAIWSAKTTTTTWCAGCWPAVRRHLRRSCCCGTAARRTIPASRILTRYTTAAR